MNLNLDGQRAAITGASRGIGRAVARQLASEGVNLALIARHQPALAALAREVSEEFGVEAVPIPADLGQPGTPEEAIGGATTALGGLDILVNNAGASPFGGFDEIGDGQWAESIDLKLMGYVRCMRAALRPMREQGSGVIVNVVGMAGRSASPGYVLGALNAALLHLTKSVGELVGSDGIRVMAVNPGLTTTERMMEAIHVWATAAGQTDTEYLDTYLRKTVPLGRLTTPEEVATAIAYLCSSAAAMATGSALQLDGGAAKGVF